MHVGEAGFAPLFRMRALTSSPTSSNNAPSLISGTERLCEEAGDRMGWHAEGNQAILRHNRLRRLGCRTQDDRIRSWEVLRAECLCDRGSLPEAKDVPDIGDRNRDGQVAGS